MQTTSLGWIKKTSVTLIVVVVVVVDLMDDNCNQGKDSYNDTTVVLICT